MTTTETVIRSYLWSEVNETGMDLADAIDKLVEEVIDNLAEVKARIGRLLDDAGV